MNWVQNHIVQLVYLFDYIGQFLPVVLTVAIIFTFYLVQSMAGKIARMTFYLDRIDNHLREITYFIKDYIASDKLPPEKPGPSQDMESRQEDLENSSRLGGKS